jgi:hypothetical protein
MQYAIEIVGSFLGATIPSWLRVFDCRKPIGQEFAVKAPWTYTVDGKTFNPTLLGSETAEVDLGLRSENDRFATTPSSGSGYGDTRVSESEARAAVSAMLRAAHQRQAEWERVSALPASTNGGGVYYKPIAVALCNYGWSLICDERISRVVAFKD